jgi:two-component system chemotaxis response regulator CheB
MTLDPPRVPIVALVASMGGLQAFSEVLGALPAGFPAAVLVMQHLEQGRESHLSRILETRTPLCVREALSGDSLAAGHVYVAPPGQHLEITARRTLRLTGAPRVEYSRPSADVLLNSLAVAGEPVIAVVLTGRGQDGAVGSVSVRRGGGTVLAQDRGTSQEFGMPGAAALAGGVDEVLPLALIAPRLLELLHNLNDVHG